VATNLEEAKPRTVVGFRTYAFPADLLTRCKFKGLHSFAVGTAIGQASALVGLSFGGTQAVLKISVTNESSKAISFQLEGKLVGPWVDELRRLSEAALAGSEAVTLDLEKVWFVDSQGISLLRDLAKQKVAQLNCSQFISQQLQGENV
jgi:ABC-type transporter Mla MlaB component